jgi:hypothetical protein
LCSIGDARSKRAVPVALEFLDENLGHFETPQLQLNFVRAKPASHVA